MDVSRLDELVRERARRRPDSPAVIDAAIRLTYRELDDRVDWHAELLQERHVRAGDLVGVCLPRSASLVVALLAVLRAGAAYVPLDPRYPSHDRGQLPGRRADGAGDR
jgi:non-ribosomal peptide synthetase component F